MTTSEPAQGRPTPQPTQPLDVDGVGAMVLGTALWTVALVVLLLGGTRPSSDNGWWLWVCAVGIIIGVIGTAFTRRRRAVYAAARARAANGPAGS